MGAQTHIEINGKKYDAITGKMLPIEQTAASQLHAQPLYSTGVVDGFRRPRTAIKRSPAAHALKNPQRAQTLMRQSVRKPDALLPKTTVVTKPTYRTPPARAARAAETPRSQHIQKFGVGGHPSSVVRRSTNLPVAAAPTHAIPLAHQPHQYPTVQNTQPSVFDTAIANAVSHNQPAHHTKRRKFANRFGVSSRALALSSAILAGVLLSGFFAVQNVPNLSMRVAAARAGFDAAMPGYQPAGFSFKGPIEYTPGKVTVSFASNSDARHYRLVQTNSNWNSDALLENFVDQDGKQYQTYLDRGRTLFIYNGSNATWVDDGVWYQIEGESNLTTDQIIRIAASI